MHTLISHIEFAEVKMPRRTTKRTHRNFTTVIIISVLTGTALIIGGLLIFPRKTQPPKTSDVSLQQMLESAAASMNLPKDIDGTHCYEWTGNIFYVPNHPGGEAKDIADPAHAHDACTLIDIKIGGVSLDNQPFVRCLIQKEYNFLSADKWLWETMHTMGVPETNPAYGPGYIAMVDYFSFRFLNLECQKILIVSVPPYSSAVAPRVMSTTLNCQDIADARQMQNEQHMPLADLKYYDSICVN